jgi:predicted transcriptional regulator
MSLSKPVRYTTVLRLLQNMHDKGLVSRDDSARSHVYESNVPPEETEARLVIRLTETAFGGSTKRLVMRALAQTPASASEKAEIRSILERAEGDVDD